MNPPPSSLTSWSNRDAQTIAQAAYRTADSALTAVNTADWIMRARKLAAMGAISDLARVLLPLAKSTLTPGLLGRRRGRYERQADRDEDDVPAHIPLPPDTALASARPAATSIHQFAEFFGEPVSKRAQSLIQRILTAALQERGMARHWVACVLAVVAATLVMLPAHDTYSVLQITFIYLFVCLGVSLTLGPGPAMLAAVLCFLAEAFFLAPPSYNFRVGQADEALTLVVFLIVAILGARLMTEIRTRTLEAERLAELDHLRGTFIAAVSHDLQTPLTAIRAGLGLLETSAGNQLCPEEQQLLSNARRNVDRLGLQINDLLSLNRLEAGQFPITLAPFDLRTVIVDSVAVAHPLIEQKGQVLEVAVDRPLLVEGDQRHLEQALVNLVTNAHYHTPAGTRITIRGRETTEGVMLEVADNGPGIPDHAQAHIFDRFYRADTASSGSGLGLSIAKAIIERHGGRVWVESQPSRGTTFFALLARQPAKE